MCSPFGCPLNQSKTGHPYKTRTRRKVKNNTSEKQDQVRSIGQAEEGTRKLMQELSYSRRSTNVGLTCSPLASFDARFLLRPKFDPSNRKKHQGSTPNLLSNHHHYLCYYVHPPKHHHFEPNFRHTWVGPLRPVGFSARSPSPSSTQKNRPILSPARAMLGARAAASFRPGPGAWVGCVPIWPTKASLKIAKVGPKKWVRSCPFSTPSPPNKKTPTQKGEPTQTGAKVRGRFPILSRDPSLQTSRIQGETDRVFEKNDG